MDDTNTTKVLEMLAAGKLTAEQAGGLIDALSHPSAPQPASAETIEKLGRLVAKHGTWRWNWQSGRRDRDAEGEEVEESMELPAVPGGVLRVRTDRSHLALRMCPDAEQITVTSRGQGPVDVTRDDDDVCISAGRAVRRLAIKVPPLARLELVVRGAHAKLEDLTGHLDADVKGGHLQVSGAPYVLSGACLGGHARVSGQVTGIDFSVAGGSCSVAGLRLASGEHRLAVAGGHADVALLPGCSVRIQARAVGGYCKVDLPGSERNAAGERVVGAGDAVFELRAKGGHVNLRETKEQ